MTTTRQQRNDGDDDEDDKDDDDGEQNSIWIIKLDSQSFVSRNSSGINFAKIWRRDNLNIEQRDQIGWFLTFWAEIGGQFSAKLSRLRVTCTLLLAKIVRLDKVTGVVQTVNEYSQP